MVIKTILSEFAIPKDNYSFEKITSGHINSSYAILDGDLKRKYLLQQIDRLVFKDIPMMMQNITVVIDHLSLKKSREPKLSGHEHLSIINTQSGQSYHKATDGEYWRLYNYIDGKTFDSVEDVNQAFEAGAIFGDFLNDLSDLNPTLIGETIPDFHNIHFRLEQFQTSLQEVDPERLLLARPEIDFVEHNKAQMVEFYDQLTNSNSKLHIVHSDTKLSNLLFNDKGKALAVIDYDTIMPGYVALDYGDSVRTICSTTAEDDPNVKGTTYDLKLLESFTQGFFNKASKMLSPYETKLMPKAVVYMPFLMGLRMLTDFLNNDVYYHTRYEVHNLVRAINQFKLAEDGNHRANDITQIIDEEFKRSK